MVLLTSSVLNLLILVLILSASGQNWCFWLFTVGLLFFFFFSSEAVFSRYSYLDHFFRAVFAGLHSSPHPPCSAYLHAPGSGPRLQDVISLGDPAYTLGTINNYVCTSNSQLSPVPNLLWVPHLHKTNHKWKYDVLLVILSFNPHHNAKIPSEHLFFIFLLWMRSLFPTEDIVFPCLVLPPVMFVTNSRVS